MEQQNIEPQAQNNSKIMLIIIGVLVILLIAVTTFSFWQRTNIRLQAEKEQAELIRSREELEGEKEKAEVIAEKEIMDVQIPSGFRLYENKRLGFALNIPTETIIDTLRAGQGVKESIEVIESDNVVYITYKSKHSYSDAIRNAESQLSDIEKTKGIAWAIMVRDVRNEEELEKLIKERYYPACSLGELRPSLISGVYDVLIERNTRDSQVECPLNYIYYFKYSPELQKVAIWDVGQDYNFLLDDIECVDCVMADSFRFLK